MKKNSDFKKFLGLKEKYKNNQTKAQKEEVKSEVKRLIGKGWATPSGCNLNFTKTLNG